MDEMLWFLGKTDDVHSRGYQSEREREREREYGGAHITGIHI